MSEIKTPVDDAAYIDPLEFSSVEAIFGNGNGMWEILLKDEHFDTMRKKCSLKKMQFQELEDRKYRIENMKTLYDRLETYGNSDFYGMHMPGHKRNRQLIPNRILMNWILRKLTDLMIFTIQKK